MTKYITFPNQFCKNAPRLFMQFLNKLFLSLLTYFIAHDVQKNTRVKLYIQLYVYLFIVHSAY
jgi:hypothetical protein